jgi:hypothetical protein
MAEITITQLPIQLNAGGSNGLKSIAIQNTGSVNIYVSQRPNVQKGGANSGLLLTAGATMTVDCQAANLKSPWYAACDSGDVNTALVTTEEFY